MTPPVEEHGDLGVLFSDVMVVHSCLSADPPAAALLHKIVDSVNQRTILDLIVDPLLPLIEVADLAQPQSHIPL